MMYSCFPEFSFNPSACALVAAGLSPRNLALPGPAHANGKMTTTCKRVESIDIGMKTLVTASLESPAVSNLAYALHFVAAACADTVPHCEQTLRMRTCWQTAAVHTPFTSKKS